MKVELTLKGMKCSNCANKVEKLLKETDKINTVYVNLITDKVFISFNKEMDPEQAQMMVDEIKTKLTKSGFTILNVNLDINKKDNNNRLMTIKLHLNDNNKTEQIFQTIQNEITNFPGILNFNTTLKSKKTNNESNDDHKMALFICKIEYDPMIVKGIHLLEKIESLISDLSSNKKSEVQLNIENEENNKQEIIGTKRHTNLEYKNQFIINLENINSSHISESKTKFFVCIFLTAILMFLTMSGNSLKANYLKKFYIYETYLSLYLLIILILSGLLIFLYGLPIYKRAIYSLIRNCMLNMESLITLGSLSAIILTIINIFKNIFDEMNQNKEVHGIIHSIEAAATVVSIATIGKFIEDRAKSNIRNQKMKMFKNLNQKQSMKCTWMRARNRNFVPLEEKEVDVGLIEKDDLIKLKEKDFLMMDGVIVHGEVEIKEDITFGYDIIQKRMKGDKVKAGCEILKGSCVIMVEEILENSLICKLTEEVSSNLNQKLKFQNLLDKIIKLFVPFVIILAFVVFFIWVMLYLFCGEDSKPKFGFVIERPISILVVSCPCAFGLAIPTVITIALNLGLKYGILIKNVSILSEIKNANIFVFDKTGTLTEISREIKVEYDITTRDNYEKEEINENSNKSNSKISHFNFKQLSLYDIVAEIEKTQKHPIAELIYSFCMKREKLHRNYLSFTIGTPNVESNGIMAKCKSENNEYEIRIGNLDFIKKESKNFDLITEEIHSIINNCMTCEKLTLCYVSVDNQIALIFSIDSSSSLRSEAKSVINYLQNNLKKEVYILSGDSIETVIEVGKKLNIPEERCLGNIDNRNKKENLLKLKNSNKNNKILMIGDGINDALSLSEADFGISFNANSNLNLIASDIIFVKEDLRLILSLLKLSRLSFVFIIINVFWAFIYNICMIPITAGVLYAWNVQISPTISSFSMLCSSLLILITSNLLRFFKLNYDLISKVNNKTKLKDINEANNLLIKDCEEIKNSTRSEYDNLEEFHQKKKGNKKSKNLSIKRILLVESLLV